MSNGQDTSKPSRRLFRMLPLILFLCADLASARSADSELLIGPLHREELTIEPSPISLRAVPASEVSKVELEGIVEFGYQDAQGRYVVDILEKSQADLAVRILTPEGQPVTGAMPDITSHGSGRLVLTDLVSDHDGVMSFALMTGNMGVDRVTASIGDASIEFTINIISRRAAGFPQPQHVEGGLPWDDLMSAKLDYNETGIVASFPTRITDRAGTIVKLSGFMMPLEADLKQRHFLLTSNPPSCFFHIPGGPAGSVEVVATEGIEVSFDPIVLEGRFEPQASSDLGIVYRLLEAKRIDH